MDRFCKLCNSHHRQLSSPAEWKNEQAHAYVLSLQVTPEKSTQGNSSIDCSEKESDKDLGTMDSFFNHLSHLHTQINIFRAKDAQPPFEYDELDFDDLIKQIDPQLWNAVCLLTRSTSEIRGTSKVNDPSSSAYHTKRVRCLFLLCTIVLYR